MGKLTLSICIFILSCQSLWSQKEEPELPLAKKLASQFGYKTTVVCLNSNTIVSFDTAGSVAKATIETKEKFISLKDLNKFTNVLECNEYFNVSDIRVYDNKHKAISTDVIDISNEDGEEFFSGQRARAFAMYFPSAGSIRSSEAQTIITDLKYLNQFYFVNSYPVLDDSIIFRVPNWVNVAFKEVNFDGYDIQKKISEDAKSHITTYAYIIKNMPADHFGEENVPGASYMYPHVLVMCKSYTRSGGRVVPVIGSMNDIYQWYELLVKQAGNNDASLTSLVSKIIEGKTTDKEKAKAIYYWVQDNIRYLAFENGIMGYKPTPCQTVVKNKYGDCKCMANLLTEMLKLAGLDARRAWLGTNEIAYDFSTPSLAVHNHAICVLLLNGKHYYLDATAGYASFGYDNDMIQGRDIIFEDGSTYLTEKIPVALIENNRITINKTLSLNDNLITGNAQYNYNGDSKTTILYEYNHLPSTDKDMDMKHFIEHHDPNISLSTIKISDLKNLDTPVMINYEFTAKNQVTKFDKDTYVAIDYDKAFQNMEFDSTRYCDYEFDFRLNYEVNDTLVIPNGYSVKHIPEDLNITTPDYSFVIKTTKYSDKIIYHKELKILNETIRKKNFPEWNAAIKQLRNTCEDQIILNQS